MGDTWVTRDRLLYDMPSYATKHAWHAQIVTRNAQSTRLFLFFQSPSSLFSIPPDLLHLEQPFPNQSDAYKST